MGGVATALAVTASTLWDYRLFDVRIFDFAAVMCLVGYLAFSPEPRTNFMNRRKDSIVLFATLMAYALLGFILHGHRSSAAMIVLAMLSFLLIGRRDWIIGDRFFTWLLICHITTFLVQFFAFELFNVMIDYQAITGSYSRIDQGLAQGTHQIRASGLFQEANSYSLNVFVLGSIVTLQRPHLPLVTLAAITMALSQSLWGIAAACVLLLLYCIQYREAGKRMLAVGLIFVAAVNGYLWLNIREGESIPFVYSRVLRIFSDTSVRERFVVNKCFDDVMAKNEAVSTPARIASTLFGQGLSTHYFKECLAANGVSLLFKSFGLIGFALLLAGFAMALRGLSRRAKLYAATAISFSFTTYPLVTYLLFWLWLPAIIGLLRIDAAKNEVAATPANSG